MSVDWSKAARTTGGVSASDTVMVRGAFGWRCFPSGAPGPEAKAVVAVSASPQITKMRIGGFMALCSVRLCRLALGEPRDALGESVLGNQLGPAHAVFGFGGERGIAALVEIQANNLGESIAAHVQRLAVLQALKESELLFGHLEQLGIPLAVERRILQKQERRAGVNDGIGILAKVFRRLPNHCDAAKILADGLDGRKSAFEQLAVLHRTEDFFDEDVLGYAKVGGVVEHIVDAPEQPHH